MIGNDKALNIILGDDVATCKVTTQKSQEIDMFVSPLHMEVGVSDAKDTNDSRVIFETSSIIFNPRHFLLELIVHILYPFFNWYSPKAHQFGPVRELSFPALLFVHVSNILVYVMIIANYMSNYVNDYTWIAPYMLFVVHRIMVAVKYGSFSNSEYA